MSTRCSVHWPVLFQLSSHGCWVIQSGYSCLFSSHPKVTFFITIFIIRQRFKFPSSPRSTVKYFWKHITHILNSPEFNYTHLYKKLMQAGKNKMIDTCWWNFGIKHHYFKILPAPEKEASGCGGLVQRFSDFSMHSNHTGNCLKSRFWFCRSEIGLQFLHF